MSPCRPNISVSFLWILLNRCLYPLSTQGMSIKYYLKYWCIYLFQVLYFLSCHKLSKIGIITPYLLKQHIHIHWQKALIWLQLFSFASTVARCVDGPPTSEVIPVIIRSWPWMIDSHPFRSMEISPLIPQIKLYQTLTLKLQYQCQRCDQRASQTGI